MDYYAIDRFCWMGSALSGIDQFYHVYRPGLGCLGIINRLGGYVAFGPAQNRKLGIAECEQSVCYTAVIS